MHSLIKDSLGMHAREALPPKGYISHVPGPEEVTLAGLIMRVEAAIAKNAAKRSLGADIKLHAELALLQQQLRQEKEARHARNDIHASFAQLASHIFSSAQGAPHAAKIKNALAAKDATLLSAALYETAGFLRHAGHRHAAHVAQNLRLHAGQNAKHFPWADLRDVAKGFSES